MDTKKIINLVIVLIASFILGYVLGCNNRKEVVVPSTPVTIVKDSIIRDEIIKENEVIKWKIRDAEKQYDKEVSTILSNTDSANLIYFSNYIRQYKDKQRTTEDN
jgi:hypothetical protein